MGCGLGLHTGTVGRGHGCRGGGCRRPGGHELEPAAGDLAGARWKTTCLRGLAEGDRGGGPILKSLS